jgi:hypothetical protein
MNQGLGHFVRQRTRPIILFRSISLEHNSGGSLNGKVTRRKAHLLSGPSCINSMSWGIWVSFLGLMLSSCPCSFIIFYFWNLMLFYGSCCTRFYPHAAWSTTLYFASPNGLLFPNLDARGHA